MRLTSPSTHRTSPMVGASCPCCFGALEGVKHAMGEVSRTLAVPMPLSIQPALDAVRVSGRHVLAGLKGALGHLVQAPDMVAFRAAVAGLDGAIEAAGTADVPARELDTLVALQAALGCLSDALTTLAMELDDASEQASRSGQRFRCAWVADQGRRFETKSDVADARVSAGVALKTRARMAGGLGR